MLTVLMRPIVQVVVSGGINQDVYRCYHKKSVLLVTIIIVVVCCYCCYYYYYYYYYYYCSRLLLISYSRIRLSIPHCLLTRTEQCVGHPLCETTPTSFNTIIIIINQTGPVLILIQQEIQDGILPL